MVDGSRNGGRYSGMTNFPGKTVVITGAFSYTGKYATRILLERGYRILTLTYHPERENTFGDRVQAFPYNFDHPERLTEVLQGASTLINTYWVRFPRGDSTFESAVQNTRTLIAAAKSAGVKRIVHVSIANPSLESNLGYYKGKAQLEKAVVESGLAYTILRPTVIFGLEDILINNIAWCVRHFPVFAIPGDGGYRIRPIFVEDMARLITNAVEQQENAVLDAVGPETYTFEELVNEIAGQLRQRIRLAHSRWMGKEWSDACPAGGGERGRSGRGVAHGVEAARGEECEVGQEDNRATKGNAGNKEPSQKAMRGRCFK